MAAWRSTVQARVFSLIINSTQGDLEHISDEVHTVTSLDVTEHAVESVLSI